MFVGYPSHTKGYKVLNLAAKTIYLSRDVSFLEHIFPFVVSSIPSTCVSTDILPSHWDNGHNETQEMHTPFSSADTSEPTGQVHDSHVPAPPPITTLFSHNPSI